MSSLAKYTVSQGYKIGGSDTSNNGLIADLKRAGAKIYMKHDANNVKGYDTVVYSSAIGENNSELIFARKNNLKIYDRVEYLNYVISKFENIIAISGSHGKTTVAAILSNIFKTANKDFCSFIGGTDKNLSNFYRQGNEENCIVEACEYKQNFLKLSYDQGVILNVDTDHPDCYKDYKEVLSAFQTFADNAYDVVFVDFGLKNKIKSKKVVTFGYTECADYYAADIKQEFGKIYFSVYKNKKKILDTYVYGFQRHCVKNALAAIVVALYNKITVTNIADGVQGFIGTERRNEFLGKYNGCDFYADYCHHPAQIVDTIESFKNLTTNSLRIIFQPHTYSRTKALFEDFVDAFSFVDNLVIYKTYPARETYNSDGDAKKLSKRLQKSVYMDNEKALKEYITTNCKNNDICLVLGAGSIYDISKKILGSLV